MPSAQPISTCPCCGLAQWVPDATPGQRLCCARCHAALVRRSVIGRSSSRTAALATAALVLYPVAVGLPIMQIERFGHAHEASILEGVSTLFGSGHVVVALVVLVCSVVVPLGKLLALLVLSAGGQRIASRHLALTYRLVEWTGRWGMLDVLLVAMLVAIVKLGDIVTVSAGPAALAFTCVVVLSLLATACFDPHSLWRSE